MKKVIYFTSLVKIEIPSSHLLIVLRKNSFKIKQMDFPHVIHKMDYYVY